MEKYQYDVAISFAEEDREIAEKISHSCKTIGLEPYFYKDETAENWGENLFNIIVDRYKDTARFALILISKHYVQKKWTDIERQIIQSVSHRSEASYLLPVRLDETVLEGLTDNTIYVIWEDNAVDIAEMIESKLKTLKSNVKSKKQSQDKVEEKSKISIKTGDNSTVIGNAERDATININK